ncbi:MAG: AAA family ATPase, partial [Planctomycetota bacterium]
MTDPTTAPPELGDLLADTLLARARPHDPALLRATIVLLCRERANGHVCVPLAAWQGQARAGGAAPFPAPVAWRDQLLASGLCGDGDPAAPPLPLVLDDHHRLYLRRDFVAERRIARWIRTALATPPRHDAGPVANALAALGSLPAPSTAADWQLAAVVAGVRSRFTVLTGGPGTGKTTTVARLLALRLQLQPESAIALCAPTGKAAARLGESLRQQAPGIAERLQPTTLHRLLRYQALEDRFRAGGDEPLPHDFVVVDEASMADPALLAALCDALTPAASLVLV